MQVADSTQLATSATLGGSTAIDFGITDDPAFFQILSANLYSNQKLAVVREVLCNLWDAHIDAEITGTAGLVEITEEGNLIFRDYGKGIAPENMGAVYGTYGASTKKNDSRSTGGFGLGCKSPFAYTDSFRVTSHHNGIKTIYNITKSSIESGGKPGIIPIMSAPTTETGLEVSIPIEERDQQEFIRYIRYIVLHGEMRIKLKLSGYYSSGSSDRLSTLGMSTEVGSYDFNHENWFDSYMGDHAVFIRYGGVVYPALDTPATRPALDTIKRFMRIVDVRRIVVQAAPDSLALTPSREALSSQKMTENGIVDLCLSLTDRLEKDIRRRIPDAVKKVAERLKESNVRHFSMLSWFKWEASLDTLLRRYITSSLGKTLLVHYDPMMRNAEMAAYRKEFKDNLYCKQLLNAIHTVKETGNTLAFRKLFHKFVAKPLLKSMDDPNLDIENLRSVQFNPYMDIKNKNHDVYSRNMNIVAMAYSMDKKVIFVSKRLRDVVTSCWAWPGFGANKQKEKNFFVYRVGAKKDESLIPVATLKEQGWQVVDLTQNHSWDPVVISSKNTTVSKKPAKTKVTSGLVPIRNLCHGTKDNFTFVKEQVKNRSTWLGHPDNPLFYVEYNEVSHFYLGNYCTNLMLTDETLDNGVVVRTGVERNMAIKRGAVHVDAYFIKQVMQVYTSKEMKKYLTKQRQISLTNHGISSPVLKLVAALGIKIPGLDKLCHKAELEDVISLIEEKGISKAFNEDLISETEYLKAMEVTRYRLEELPCIKQIKSILRDEIIYDIGIDSMRNILAKNPERKATFRSLVLFAMKNGTKK